MIVDERNVDPTRAKRRAWRTSRRRLVAGASAGLVSIATPAGGGKARQATPAAPGMTRVVRDLTGREVEVPAAPQRVVALDPNRTIVNLVEIGLAPVGATRNPTNPAAGFAPVIAGAADGIADVGLIGAASIEAVAALRPDLIFYATNYQEIPLAALEVIAPTVTYEAPLPAVDAHLAFVGAAVGREEEAERVAAEFAATVAARREGLGLAGRRVGACGFVNYEGGAGFWVGGPDNVLGTLLLDLGAELVPKAIGGRPVTDFAENVSLEVIAEVLAEAEVVVATRYYGDAEVGANFERMVESPLWRRVPAVGRGEVAILDVQPAFGNWGVRGLELALAELEA
jgi:iron complex transport system substrate-binding protein